MNRHTVLWSASSSAMVAGERAEERAGERAELPLVDVDPLRVREVLVNLLANALRHTSAAAPSR